MFGCRCVAAGAAVAGAAVGGTAVGGGAVGGTAVGAVGKSGGEELVVWRAGGAARPLPLVVLAQPPRITTAASRPAPHSAARFDRTRERMPRWAGARSGAGTAYRRTRRAVAARTRRVAAGGCLGVVEAAARRPWHRSGAARPARGARGDRLVRTHPRRGRARLWGHRVRDAGDPAGPGAGRAGPLGGDSGGARGAHHHRAWRHAVPGGRALQRGPAAGARPGDAVPGDRPHVDRHRALQPGPAPGGPAGVTTRR